MKKKIISQNQAKDATTPNAPNTPITKDEDGRERRHTGGNQSAEKPPLPPDKHGPPPTTPPPPVPGGTAGNTSQNKLSLQPSTKGTTYTVLYIPKFEKNTQILHFFRNNLISKLENVCPFFLHNTLFCTPILRNLSFKSNYFSLLFLSCKQAKKMVCILSHFVQKFIAILFMSTKRCKLEIKSKSLIS